ncbi:MAG: glycine cleavage system aminomethyltransferase GcvT [Ruminiclostridium sp.]|nr:glycine cleavage system aminomethyltransferase GcvT [Ruminiclostridium sp.]
MEAALKRTPLYEIHRSLGGKLIDFGGWELPVQYSGILEEHQQVRSAAGLFDVSHMGEITVKGRDAEKFLQKLITNDISHTKDFQVMYSPVCYSDGGIVDDLLVYKYNSGNYLLVVNAANTDKDFTWMLQNLEDEVELENVSAAYAQIAIQGPKAEAVLQKLTDFQLDKIRFYHFIPDVVIAGVNTITSRTGYTGEDGFEIYLPAKYAVLVWEKLMEAGKEDGLAPAGLGARDTLRFEAALPLYGHEISEDISPLEAGLGKFVKLDKKEFIGKKALANQKEKGIPRKLAGFEMLDRGIPRSHYDVQADGASIGFVTTGSYSPTLAKNIGLALLDSAFAAEGTVIDIIIRGRALKGKVSTIPFYSKKYKK